MKNIHNYTSKWVRAQYVLTGCAQISTFVFAFEQLDLHMCDVRTHEHMRACVCLYLCFCMRAPLPPLPSRDTENVEGGGAAEAAPAWWSVSQCERLSDGTVLQLRGARRHQTEAAFEYCIRALDSVSPSDPPPPEAR